MKRWLVVVLGIAAALAVWLVAVPVLGVDLLVDAGGRPQTVGPAEVALVAALAGLAGWGVVALFERTLRRPRLAWLVAAPVVLLVSLLGPLGGATAGAVVALAAMHLAVGAAVIPLLARTIVARTAAPAEPALR